MQSCLQSAGFSPQEIKTSKNIPIEFMKKNIVNESTKLQQMMNLNLTSRTIVSTHNTMQLPQAMNHNGNLAIPIHTSQSRNWKSTQVPPINNSAPLSQQNMNYVHVDHSHQAGPNPGHNLNYPPRPTVTCPHNPNLVKSNVAPFPKVFDTKEGDKEDDEWKTILYKSESTLDRILGLIK